MLDLGTWQDLVVAFVHVEARRLGWSVHRVRQQATGSIYVELRMSGGRRAVIRVSDHRPSRSLKRRDSLLSIRQPATGRVRDLRRFLENRADKAVEAA